MTTSLLQVNSNSRVALALVPASTCSEQREPAGRRSTHSGEDIAFPNLLLPPVKTRSSFCHMSSGYGRNHTAIYSVRNLVVLRTKSERLLQYLKRAGTTTSDRGSTET